MMSLAETQSIVTMHAMACGLPVIVARAWGLPEYVKSDRGILVKPDSLKELVEKIRWLYHHQKNGQELGHKGKIFVSKLGPKQVAQTWEKIYQDVISKKNPVGSNKEA